MAIALLRNTSMLKLSNLCYGKQIFTSHHCFEYLNIEATEQLAATEHNILLLC